MPQTKLSLSTLFIATVMFAAPADSGTVRQDASSTGAAFGQVVWVLQQCGNFDLALETRTLALKEFGPSVKSGEAALGKFDVYNGNCAEIVDIAERYVEARRANPVDWDYSNEPSNSHEVKPKGRR